MAEHLYREDKMSFAQKLVEKAAVKIGDSYICAILVGKMTLCDWKIQVKNRLS